MSRQDQELIRYALIGLEQQKRGVEEKINEIQAVLRNSEPETPKASSVQRRGKGMSKAGRDRIAAAQRARWAAHRNASSTNNPKKRAATPAKKRTLSVEARARMAEAQRKSGK